MGLKMHGRCNLKIFISLLLRSLWHFSQYPDGHTSRSIYVAFKMIHASQNFPEGLKKYVPSLGIAIWTTTPWTIPANAGSIII
jgi:isoleucyl-tRNA synthetase